MADHLHIWLFYSECVVMAAPPLPFPFSTWLWFKTLFCFLDALSFPLLFFLQNICMQWQLVKNKRSWIWRADRDIWESWREEKEGRNVIIISKMKIIFMKIWLYHLLSSLFSLQLFISTLPSTSCMPSQTDRLLF